MNDKELGQKNLDVNNYSNGRKGGWAMKRIEKFFVRVVVAVFILGAGSTVGLSQTSSSQMLPQPADAPKLWKNLIGIYASPQDTLYVAEKDNHLFVVTKALKYVMLSEDARGLYVFNNERLFGESALTFASNGTSRPTSLTIGGVTFQRLILRDESGTSFRIKPLRSADELRTIALAANPPTEDGDFLKLDLVDLSTLDSTIKFDIRYATTNNFIGEKFYTQAKAFLQRPAAEGLLRAHLWLKRLGFGLLIHDAYRPWYVTKMFWDATPDDKKIFVANPSQGSRHNRGCAVDLTLYDLRTGKQVEMTGGYDEMSERSYSSYPGGTSLERWHRDLLRQAMSMQGFAVFEWEWWHFDYKDWRRYPIGTKTFEELER